MNSFQQRIANLWLESKKLNENRNPTRSILAILFPDEYNEILLSFKIMPDNVFDLIDIIQKYLGQNIMTESERNELQIYIIQLLRKSDKKTTASYDKFKFFMYNYGVYLYLALFLLNWYRFGVINYVLLVFLIVRYFVSGTVKGRIMLKKEENYSSFLLTILDILLPPIFIYFLVFN